MTRITIELDVSDEYVRDDIIRALELLLPYMADNVVVTSNDQT